MTAAPNPRRKLFDMLARHVGTVKAKNTCELIAETLHAEGYVLVLRKARR